MPSSPLRIPMHLSPSIFSRAAPYRSLYALASTSFPKRISRRSKNRHRSSSPFKPTCRFFFSLSRLTFPFLRSRGFVAGIYIPMMQRRRRKRSRTGQKPKRARARPVYIPRALIRSEPDFSFFAREAILFSSALPTSYVCARIRARGEMGKRPFALFCAYAQRDDDYDDGAGAEDIGKYLARGIVTVFFLHGRGSIFRS